MTDSDFEGWAVLDGMYGINGKTISKGCFSAQNGLKVPIYFRHQQDKENLIGRGTLYEKDKGMYFYGHFFEDNENTRSIKKDIQNGDIKTMSIFANELKFSDTEVIKGHIIEISLVPYNEQPPEYQDTVITNHKDWSELVNE